MRILKDQDFKAAIIKHVSMSYLNTLETYEKTQILSKEIKDIKKNLRKF